MTGTPYRRGNAYESRVAEDLRADGYEVWQSRGSKGAADLIAIKAGEILLVQVKNIEAVDGVESMDGTGWNDLWALAQTTCSTPLIADRTGPAGRRIRYRRITARHRPGSHDWPAEPWTPDDAELAAAIARHPAGWQQ